MTPRRFAWAPIEEHLRRCYGDVLDVTPGRAAAADGWPVVRMADLLGVSRHVVVRSKRTGTVSPSVADRLATNLGRPPLEFWPDFDEVGG